MQSRLDIALHPRIVYDKPTLNALVDHLITEVFTSFWCEVQLDGSTDTVDNMQKVETENLELRNEISVQQKRWLSLIRNADYGQRVVPMIFHGCLVPKALRAALVTVFKRHDLLCMIFPDDRSVVLPAENLVPQLSKLIVDIDLADVPNRIIAIHEQINICREALIDPSIHPSWALRCIKSSESEFILLLGLQHLAFDGTSLTVFVDELREAYLAECQGSPLKWEPAIPYSHYVASQAAYLNDGISRDRDYFAGLFTGLERTTALPDHQGFDTTTAHPSQRFTPNTPLASWVDLYQAASKLDVTPFSILMAGYAILVGELTDTNEVVIGVIKSGRGDPHFNRTVGPFTSPFPVPVALGADPVGLARRIDRLMTGIGAYSDYPPTDLIEHVDAFENFPMDTYFTDCCINFLNYRRIQSSQELEVEVLEVLAPIHRPEFANFGFDRLRRIPGLHLVIDIHDGKIRPNYWYHSDRFEFELVKSWAKRHAEIMDRVVACFEEKS